MSQVTLQLHSGEDLQFLLILAKKLNISVLSVKTDAVSTAKKAEPSAFELMKMAAVDPLFLADVEAVAADFEHADLETI